MLQLINFRFFFMLLPIEKNNLQIVLISQMMTLV